MIFFEIQSILLILYIDGNSNHIYCILLTSSIHFIWKIDSEFSKSSQVIFIYIALYTIQIVSKQFYSIKQQNSVDNI